MAHFRRIFGLGLLAAGIAAAQGRSYLALGDSIPFGFNPTVPIGDIADYKGYPLAVAQALSLSLANASCPGETSASFLNVNAPDDGCHEYRDAQPIPGPMFVPYASNDQSQLQFAIAYLRSHRATKLVTITIGGDDLRLLQIACSGQADPQACELNGLGSVLANYSKHLAAIYLAIRLEGGYFGPIVAANYFSPDYTNALDDLAVGSLNAVTLGVTAAFGGKVADVFSAFQAASVSGGGLPCQATPVPLAFTDAPGVCDVHPTLAGQQLIAQLVVNALK